VAVGAVLVILRWRSWHATGSTSSFSSMSSPINTALPSPSYWKLNIEANAMSDGSLNPSWRKSSLRDTDTIGTPLDDDEPGCLAWRWSLLYTPASRFGRDGEQ
jgi:hypothetical protein